MNITVQYLTDQIAPWAVLVNGVVHAYYGCPWRAYRAAYGK